MTRVEIAAGGHQVTVEAAEPLLTVAGQALALWQATDSPDTVRAGTATGFVTENAAAAAYDSEARSSHRST